MKNMFYIIFLSSISWLSAQKLGEKKLQSEVFGSQPTWLQLNKKDMARKMVMSDYFSIEPQEKILCWNAVTDGMAEVQSFKSYDSVWVVTRPDNQEFLYKVGCQNRLKYIRTDELSSGPAKTPTVVYIRDTVYKETVVLNNTKENEAEPETEPEPEPRNYGRAVIYGGSVYTEPVPVYPPAAKNPVTGNWDAPWNVDQRFAYWNRPCYGHRRW